MTCEGTRPPVSSPEFAPHFEMVVRTSKNAREAASRLGYAYSETVRYHMKKLGMQSPREWSRRPHLAFVSQQNIPQVVIPTLEGRRWVGALIQGEGCIQCTYRAYADCTYLNLDTAMVDPAPIFRLSDYYGLPRPAKPAKNHQWKPLWRKNIGGLRALRVLQEILPFLFGEKKSEAQKALAFFSPRGCHRGRFSSPDVWPRSEFPFRTKRRGANPQSDAREA